MVIFHTFCLLLVFFKFSFFLKILRVSKSLDSDQVRHFFRPDLGPNCLQRLSADNSSRQSVKQSGISGKIFNDLGLVYTQLQNYDLACSCFENALPLVRAPSENKQLEAVILQNLGASYNFQGEYQRSIKFHEDAADAYGKIYMLQYPSVTVPKCYNTRAQK